MQRERLKSLAVLCSGKCDYEEKLNFLQSGTFSDRFTKS